MKIIGLTGNSGSGKGAAAAVLAKKGALILDCDKIAHENMQPKGAAYADILNAFGKSVLKSDGTIDRKKLGGIVFNDKKSLELLNSITHKYIKEYIENAINEYADKYKYIVIDAPLLKEAGLEALCDSVWLIYADEQTRLERVMQRDNITKDAALLRFGNQRSSEELKKIADIVIENVSDISNLEMQINKALQ